jgi:transcription initiation factor TFIID TATA-box-binding protein
MTHLVNAVGGGDLNQEVDLNELYIDIKGEEVRYAPEHWPGLSVKFTDDSPTVMIFRTGKYNIAGASSISELKSANKKIITQLQKLNIGGNVSDFEVRNLVYLHNYEN